MVWVVAANILIVTDRPETGQIWGYALRQRGLVCDVVFGPERTRGRETPAWSLALVDFYDAGAQPVQVCEALGAQRCGPILLLWDARDESSLLSAYRAGAAEVILRPISPLLLMAKLEAWLRHAQGTPVQASGAIECAGLCLQPDTRTLTLEDDRCVRLSILEFRLLYALMLQPRQVHTTEALLAHIWAHNGADSAQLKNVVYRLRRKIEPDPRQPRYVQLVPGRGYTLGGL
jgi:DNA-binding response OmpR family regulator